jgi:uncharacterized membrane protein (DUF106 family)
MTDIFGLLLEYEEVIKRLDSLNQVDETINDELSTRLSEIQTKFQEATKNGDTDSIPKLIEMMSSLNAELEEQSNQVKN